MLRRQGEHSTMNGRNKILLFATVMTMAVLLTACAPPTAKLTVSRNEVNSGEPVTVRWETKNAKEVTLNGEKVDKIGGKSVIPPDTTNYEIVAKRGKKEARESATVKVNSNRAAAPTVRLTADKTDIERGQNTKLRWETTNSKIVTISGVGEVSGSGEREVSPRVSTTYTATALGDGGNATSSVRVTVTDPPPPPIAERPRTVAEVAPTNRAIADQFVSVMKPVYFDLDKSEIKASEQGKLRTLAEWLNRDTNRTIVFKVEGNCDPRGTAEYNLGLGDRRAQAVKDFLVSLGVDPSRIETVSFGSEKATGTEEGEAGIVGSWANDRRADFIYLRGGEKP